MSTSHWNRHGGGHPPHGAFDKLVVTVGSVGGIRAVTTILEHLPRDFPAPVLLVQHRAATPPYLLASLLRPRTRLEVREAKEGDVLRPGVVYVASPEAHLVVRPDGRLGYEDTRRIHHLRSSANPLMETASEVFGDRVIAVVLTGFDRDGTDGVQSVKERGGIVIAQDEVSSEVFGMPGSAIATGCVDRVLPPVEIADSLVELTAPDRPMEQGPASAL